MVNGTDVMQAPQQGAPSAEVQRLMDETGVDPSIVNIVPIKIVYSTQGLGIFVGRLLLEYAAIHGPFFNGPGLPGLTIKRGDDFVRSVGRELSKEDNEDGSTLLTRALDQAILRAVEAGAGECVDLTPPSDPAEDGVA